MNSPVQFNLRSPCNAHCGDQTSCMSCNAYCRDGQPIWRTESHCHMEGTNLGTPSCNRYIHGLDSANCANSLVRGTCASRCQWHLLSTKRGSLQRSKAAAAPEPNWTSSCPTQNWRVSTDGWHQYDRNEKPKNQQQIAEVFVRSFGTGTPPFKRSCISSHSRRFTAKKLLGGKVRQKCLVRASTWQWSNWTLPSFYRILKTSWKLLEKFLPVFSVLYLLPSWKWKSNAIVCSFNTLLTQPPILFLRSSPTSPFALFFMLDSCGLVPRVFRNLVVYLNEFHCGGNVLVPFPGMESTWAHLVEPTESQTAIFDVWEDSSTKLPFLVRSAEVYFQSEMLQHATTLTQERERERDRTLGASRVSPLFVICKEALPLRNGHGRCQRSPKLFAQHIWSLETLNEDIASGWCRSMCW